LRVAFSGAHRTGKTTLLEAVSEQLRGYEAVDEPYRQLEDEGVEFGDPPSIEDFEAQLARSIENVGESGPKTLFDRCPFDLVAYLQALDEDYDYDDRLDAIRDAMGKLDLVVFVPIESPDQIAVPEHEDRALRRRVDARLHTLLVEDAHGFGIEVLEVRGSLAERVVQVRRAIHLSG